MAHKYGVPFWEDENGLALNRSIDGLASWVCYRVQLSPVKKV